MSRRNTTGASPSDISSAGDTSAAPPSPGATSGVSVQASKRLTFVAVAAAAAGAGVAGSLMALSTLRVQPDGVFSVQWSAFMIFIVVVGGVGTLEGPLIGVLVFWLLKQTLADFGPLYLILLGVLGVVFVLYIKRGLWGVFSRRGKVHLFPVGYRVRFDS